MAESSAAVRNHLDQLFQDLCVEAEVPRIEGYIEPIDFYRDYVAPSRPCLIEGVCADWMAVKKWTNNYLRSLNLEVSVAATPDGWADAIRDDKFCLPQETKMKMGEFIDKIEKPSTDEVLYIQKQNSNLDTEFQILSRNTSPILKTWGSRVFGADPDASNFWMGDSRAVTSMHKDHYENLYCVVRGFKTFTLCPPFSCMRIPHKTCKNFTHKKSEDGVWTLDPTGGETVWASGNPQEWQGVRTIKVVVKQGDCLYLPALWFHQVEQSHQCIAVNYWFDMRFDMRYCYFKMAESFNPTLRTRSQAEDLCLPAGDSKQ